MIALPLLLVPELIPHPPFVPVVPFVRWWAQWFGEYRRHPPPLVSHSGAEGRSRMCCIQLWVYAIRVARPSLVCGPYLVGLKKRSICVPSVRQHDGVVGLPLNVDHPLAPWHHSSTPPLSRICFGDLYFWETWNETQFRPRMENFSMKEAPPHRSSTRPKSSHCTIFTVHVTLKRQTMAQCRTSPAFAALSADVYGTGRRLDISHASIHLSIRR